MSNLLHPTYCRDVGPGCPCANAGPVALVCVRCSMTWRGGFDRDERAASDAATSFPVTERKADIQAPDALPAPVFPL